MGAASAERSREDTQKATIDGAHPLCDGFPIHSVVHTDALPLRKKAVATHFVEEGFGWCLQDRVSNPTRLLAVLDPHVFLAFDDRQEGLAKTFNLSPVVFVAGCEEYPFDCVRKLEARAQAPPMSKGDRVLHLVRTVAARGLPILMSALLPLRQMHVIIM